DAEYAFRHVLLRDVAYGQIPRGARGEKHQRGATWIESLGRPEDHAEMLAHHYLRALQYTTAAGREDPRRVALARDALPPAGSPLPEGAAVDDGRRARGSQPRRARSIRTAYGGRPGARAGRLPIRRALLPCGARVVARRRR